MPMIQPVAADLALPDVSPFHKAMLDHVRWLLKSARTAMTSKYDDWDRYEQAYQGYKWPDKEDLKARERKEPEKMVVPLTFAQVQTFVAFCFQIFSQRENFYELDGSGVEDFRAAKIAEALLQRDLNHSNFQVKLYQFLLDVARFGIGIFKHSWAQELQTVAQQVSVPQPPSLFGAPMPDMQQMTDQQVVKFLGNKIFNISPYRFFPDPRVPLQRFQEGEFVASEEDVTKTWLRRQEKDGLLVGTQYVKDMPMEMWEHRRHSTRTTLPMVEGKLKNGYIFTEIQLDLIPADFKLQDGTPMGEEQVPVKYLICIANDTRIVRCEPMGYLHENYTYSVASLSPDQQHQLNHGLCELLAHLQDVNTWLYNSRITSVRKTIQNQFIADPTGIEMKDLENRNPVIRLKPGAARSGVDRWIKQLDVHDVTQSHFQDAEVIKQTAQQTTGVNENASGQYSSGRRSAMQTAAVNTGAASRLKLWASLIWYQALAPLGVDMLSNLRDGLDVEQIVRVMGLQVLQPISPYNAGQVDVAQFLPVDKTHLAGNYDFIMMDGTTPGEKSDQAQVLQDLTMPLVQNPQLAALLGFDVRALFYDILKLRGIRNPEKYSLSALQQQQLMQGASMLPSGALQQTLQGAAASASSQQATANDPGLTGLLSGGANGGPPNVIPAFGARGGAQAAG